MRHIDAVSKIWVHLKKRSPAIRASRFVVDHSFEDALVCAAASRVAEAIYGFRAESPCFSKRRRTVVVLQRSIILDSGFVARLHGSLRPCG
ncbi:hypothetical protein TNCV_1447231 [Trichonephila clavipes]|nr:hypothetical protein TNCV_1447231 [Trichonephila clavipes]